MTYSMQLPGGRSFRDISFSTRDGELFKSKSGFGVAYYTPRMSKRIFRNYADRLIEVERSNGRDTAKESCTWLRQDTDKLIRAVAERPVVVVEGDLGAGKSTVLYAARKVARHHGAPYAMIDGHFGLSPKRIGAVLSWAMERKEEGGVLFWDSFDYVTKTAEGGSTKNRQKIASYCSEVLDLVGSYLEVGGTLIATSHTEPWFAKACRSEEAVSTFLDFKAALPTVRAYGMLPTAEDSKAFIHEQKNLRDQPNIFPLVEGYYSLFEQEGAAHPYALQHEGTWNQYRVLKQLLAGKEHYERTYTTLAELDFGSVTPEEALVGLCVGIQSINDTTRSLMGVTEDYRFTPPFPS